jgi:uroporphyrinogen decarboxylase
MAFEQVGPPRVPVTLIAGGEWYVHSAGKTFSEIKTKPEEIAGVFVQAFRRLGHDLLWTGTGFLNYPFHFLGCPILDDSSTTPNLVGTAIRGLDALDSLTIDTVLQNPIMQGIIHSHHLVADEIGQETLVIPTQWGPFTSAARILGTEALMLASIEDPERLTQLIRFSTELIWATAERLLDHQDILGVNFSDPVASGDLISPDTFQTFVVPFLKNLVTRTKAKGRYASIHICGDTTHLLGDILDIRPDCFSLESKVDLKTAKAVLGGKVCVAGNVSPTGSFLSGSPKAVIEDAKKCIALWSDRNGYILTVGCDFPKDVPFENIQALMSLKDSLP